MEKEKKIKILLIALKYFPASGGSATYSFNLAIGLNRLGYDVVLLAPKYKHREIDDSTSPFKVKRLHFIIGVDIIRIPIVAIQTLIHFMWFRPDVVWPTSFAGCRALGPLAFLNTKFIATIHGGGIHRRYPSKNIFKKITNRMGIRFMKRADALVTVSDYSKQIFKDNLQHDDILKKIRIIYNSLDFNEKKFFTYEKAIKMLPEYKNKKIILTVGRLIPAKGHDTVIQSVKILKIIIPDIVYIIVGEGPEKESLMKLVKKEGLEDTVKFTGYVSDIKLEMYYAVCDLFVMAGRWTPDFVEGFGLVYIEAGLRGKAVIGTNVGGIPEAIIENKTGYIIEPENPAALAEKIEFLFNNKRLLKQMGNFAAKHLKERYSNKVMAGHNSDLIKEMLGM